MVKGRREELDDYDVKKYRKKVCYFCRSKIDHIDYKDTQTLKRYISDKNKIKAKRITGACVQHQKGLANAIKIAREMALLPYVVAAVKK